MPQLCCRWHQQEAHLRRPHPPIHRQTCPRSAQTPRPTSRPHYALWQRLPHAAPKPHAPGAQTMAAEFLANKRIKLARELGATSGVIPPTEKSMEIMKGISTITVNKNRQTFLVNDEAIFDDRGNLLPKFSKYSQTFWRCISRLWS